SMKADEGTSIFLDEPLLYYRLHQTNSIGKDPLEANRETFDVLIHEGQRDELNESAILLQHLQKIRNYIETEYQAQVQDHQREIQKYQREVQELSTKIENTNNQNSLLKLKLDQMEADLQIEKHRTTELQLNLKRIEDEFQNAKLEIQSIEEEMKFLRS